MQVGRFVLVAVVVCFGACSVFPDSTSEEPGSGGDASSSGGLASGGTAAKGGSGASGGLGGGNGGTTPIDAPADQPITSGGAGSGATGGSSGGSGGSGGTGACTGVDTTSDPNNCGACGRKCVAAGTAGVVFARCNNSNCDPVCDASHLDCNDPLSPAKDDGCEITIGDDNNCGGCGMVCPTNLHCTFWGSEPKGVCTCDGGSCGNGGTCTSHRCVCGSTTCNLGEVCGAGGVCKCGTNPACSSDLQTCCPYGCFNTTVSPSHCGGCDYQCLGGMICDLGLCKCDSAADCDDGSPGQCVSGKCVCSKGNCDYGARCRADGQCH